MQMENEIKRAGEREERKRLMNVGKVYLPRYLVDLNSTFFNLCMSVSQSVSLADAMGYLCSEY